MRQLTIAVLSLTILWGGTQIALAQGKNAVPPVDSGVKGVVGTISTVGRVGSGAVDTYHGIQTLGNATNASEAAVGIAQTTAGAMHMGDIPGEACVSLYQGVKMNQNCAGSGDKLIQDSALPCIAGVVAGGACAALLSECGPAAMAEAAIGCARATEGAISDVVTVGNVLDKAQPVCSDPPCPSSGPWSSNDTFGRAQTDPYAPNGASFRDQLNQQGGQALLTRQGQAAEESSERAAAEQTRQDRAAEQAEAQRNQAAQDQANATNTALFNNLLMQNVAGRSSQSSPARGGGSETHSGPRTCAEMGQPPGCGHR